MSFPPAACAASRGVDRALRPLRRAIAEGVHATLGRPGPDDLARYATPAGDPGLFGPESLVWKVHGDLPVMLIGGFAALMLQTLHPLAMAGVAQHSRYQEDPLGRLQRTAQYVAGTSFGGMPLVDSLVRRVKAVHASVRGVAPDGRPYSADDPDLVTWVHATEVWCILRSHQRYSLDALVGAEKDRYLSEVAVLGDLLGGRAVPRSVGAFRRYFAAITPELFATPDAVEAFRFLRRPFSAGLGDAVAHRVIAEAAVDLLPHFAKRLFGLDRRPSWSGVVPGAGVVPTRATALGAGVALRFLVGPSLVRAAAETRVAALAP